MLLQTTFNLQIQELIEKKYWNPQAFLFNQLNELQ